MRAFADAMYPRHDRRFAFFESLFNTPDSVSSSLFRFREEETRLKLHMPELPPAVLLGSLGSYDLLPAIVFLPTRRRCDQAATEAAHGRPDTRTERVEARRSMLRNLSADYPEIKNHRHWGTIIGGAVAAHHAGHIPAWKLVIERLMSAGLLDAIFATSTVAAGVDFPARTVVLSNVDARTGNGWRLLTASELQQMTGRAGRRGRDSIGFIVAAPGIHQDTQRIADLLVAPPDPLQSQFRATYSTLLNLLDAYQSFTRVREVAERSFAFRDTVRQISRLKRNRDQCQQAVEQKLLAAGCEVPLPVIRGLERLASARARLSEVYPMTRMEMRLQWLRQVVVPGRIVGIGRSGRGTVLILDHRGDNIRGIREDGRSASFALDRVGRVYSTIYQLDEYAVKQAFERVRTQGPGTVIHEPRLHDLKESDDHALGILNNLIDDLVSDWVRKTGNSNWVEAIWSVIEDANAIERVEVGIEGLQAEVWQPFETRARILAYFGYLDMRTETVTDRGRWLADLRVDRPLLVGEALQSGIYNSLDSTTAAALTAALAADDERNYGELPLGDVLVSALTRYEAVAYNVSTVEWQEGIEPFAEINFSAAGAAARWAQGVSWDVLVSETRAEEGDLVRLLSRTGESLLQIAGVHKAQPAAARIAARAAEAVFREPVR